MRRDLIALGSRLPRRVAAESTMRGQCFDPCATGIRPRWLGALIERALGLESLSRIYLARPARTHPDPSIQTVEPEPIRCARGFLRYVLQAMALSIRLKRDKTDAHSVDWLSTASEEWLNRIPKHGPLIIVANHPLGGLEGLAIAELIARVRPDLKVLANALLCRIPELAPMFIGVDVLSSRSARSNTVGIRRVHSQLEAGGAVLIFPAGKVAATRGFGFRIREFDWHRFVGQLVRRHSANCLPIHVEGRNSRWFYAAGMLHERLRTLLLPRQLINKAGATLSLTVGSPITAQELSFLRSPQAVTDYLRISCEGLAGCKQRLLPTLRKTRSTEAEGSVRAICMESVVNERSVAALADCLVIDHKRFSLYCAPHSRLGGVMDEIAAGRERSFAAVGAGTGGEEDSDRFDVHYRHLFIWDRQESKVAGAYRLAFIDEVVRDHGVNGLYTRSLYRYGDDFVKQLPNAIELGRSWILPEYQRDPAPLMLLWRGIGQILVESGRHTLFGSVTISREYSELARSLIADALLTNHGARELQPLVSAVNPPRIKEKSWGWEMLSVLGDVKQLANLVGRCDDGRGLPVLLRHYLSLRGKLVCFNRHTSFNDSLEGLIVVDARQTDARSLKKFLGADGYARFEAAHAQRRVG